MNAVADEAGSGRLVGLGFRAGVLVLGLYLAFLVMEYVQGTQMRIPEAPQRVTLLEQMVKEPPPEPPEQDLPEPEIVEFQPMLTQTEVIEEAPEQQAPIDDNLGLDADASAGSDLFGLLAKRGGTSIIKLGEDGGKVDPMQKFAFYGRVVRVALEGHLAQIDALRKRNYVAKVAIWVGGDGRVEQVRVLVGSGNLDLDQQLTRALDTFRVSIEPPPEDMPQPIALKIAATGAG